MKLYALQGDVSKDLMTWRGRVIVHDSKREMEFIFRGARVVEVPRDISADMMISIKHHPDFASYQWPLERNKFR
jgi:hypothetical protein